VDTFRGAKTICVDPVTHNAYLFQPERGPVPAPPAGAAPPAVTPPPAGVAPPTGAAPPAPPQGARGRGPQGPIVAAWFIVIKQ